MEETAKGIQTESVQTTGASNTEKNTMTDESPAKKASIFCFKKRRKAGEKITEKDDDCVSLSLKPANQDSNLGGIEAEVSNSLWLAFKRLVTLRRRSRSSLKKPTQPGSSVALEIQAEDSATLHCPKEHTSLKMPCLRFSRSRKKPSRLEITEELGEKTDETTSILNKKSNSESETMGLEGPLSTEQSPRRVLEERESDGEVVKNVDNVGVPARENEFAVEPRPGRDCYADSVVQSEIIHSEKALETEQEKQIFQLHQGSLYGNPEEVESEKFDFKVDLGPLLPQGLPETEQKILEEDAKDIQATEAKLEPVDGVVDLVDGRISGKSSNAVEVMMHAIPSTMEDEVSVCSDEEGRSEENRPMMMPAVGIVITITEAEEFQEEEEPAPVYEPFSFPQASKKKGKKKANKSANSGVEGSGQTWEGKTPPKVPSPLGANDQERRTSEQYEVLLIETATSLVKAAIQSSIEQVLNEVALEQNKQNSFL
uniref:A-kinase anchor protein 5 n=1 Tax=Pogona vitticeps TaxID=103695 RepID=A0ABM5FBU3_9SAUR